MANWETIEDFYFYKCSNCNYIEGKKRKYCAGCGSRMTDYVDSDTDSGQKMRVFLWIPVSERLPENNVPVNITWINRNPAPYYAEIKDKPFTAMAVFFNGKWFWWSVDVEDMLGEYGYCNADDMSSDIEVTAWMPLPIPYTGKELKESNDS